MFHCRFNPILPPLMSLKAGARWWRLFWWNWWRHRPFLCASIRWRHLDHHHHLDHRHHHHNIDHHQAETSTLTKTKPGLSARGELTCFRFEKRCIGILIVFFLSDSCPPDWAFAGSRSFQRLELCHVSICEAVQCQQPADLWRRRCEGRRDVVWREDGRRCCDSGRWIEMQNLLLSKSSL